jgi:hypothetical protein
MFIKNQDLQILQQIELELWNKGDTENYLRIYYLIEKLLNQKKQNNNKNWARIKGKRELDKNYARSIKERKEI